MKGGSKSEAQAFCKSYKIPIAIKKQFIDQVQRGITVKKAAQRYQLKYSTARMIYQRFKIEQNRKKKENQMVKQEQNLNGEMIAVGNRKTGKEPICGYLNSDQLKENSEKSEEETQRRNRISIISTVAWDFMSNGVPPFRESSSSK